MQRLALILIALALSGGCFRPSGSYSTPPTDTAVTNARRRELPIREIQPIWTFQRREFGAEDWGERADAPTIKRVQRGGGDNISISWEEDYYYTGATYPTPNGGTAWEFVTLHFDYPTSRLFINYCGPNKVTASRITTALTLEDSGYCGATNEETATVADEILTRLGLKRLE